MPKAARALAVTALSLLGAAGCRKTAGSEEAIRATRASIAVASAGPALAATPSASAGGTAAPPLAPVVAPLAGERIDVPGGTFKAGSVPGEEGRKPEIEERLTSVELGPFRIDRLPYPNDPARPPLVALTRDGAERLCEEHGSRLCTEIEWERACKGPTSQRYVTGDAWNERCAREPHACASGFDVLAMGSVREWTSSDVFAEGDGPRKAAVRGAAPDAPPTQHRCAARTAESADGSSDAPKSSATSSGIGFRCCKGAKNAVLVEEPRAGTTFVQAQITPARLSALFEANPKTRRLTKDVRFFREPDGAETVVARGPGDRKGFLFTVLPLRWNPVAGAEFLVVTGRSGDDTSFVVVFHVLGKDEYLLAASFIMEHEMGPVALAYNGYIRPRLHFSTCWGCPGETGKILYKDPDAATITQP